MDYREKVKRVKEIMGKYFGVLESLPEGGKIDEDLARRIGIPADLKPLVESAYKYGRLKGRTKAEISEEFIESYFKELSPKGKELLGFQKDIMTSEIESLLSKNRSKLTRKTVDMLKLNFAVTGTVFKDEKMLPRWMAHELRKVTDDYRQDWDMVVRTELVNARQQGIADEIMEGTSPYSDLKGDTIVFKRPQANCCKHCARLYLEDDGITPKTFKLSEMMNYGTNIGRKTADWKPVVGTVHPHCLTDDAEIYTMNGWKLFKDLTNRDKVLTMDLETWKKEWQIPSAYVEYTHNDKVIEFKGKNINLLTTDKHNMLISRDGKSLELVRAKDLKKIESYYIPRFKSKSSERMIASKDIEIREKSYKGKVYCVEVPRHHTILVRRNGKKLWTGNCQCELSVLPEGTEFDSAGNIVVKRKEV